MKNILLSIFCLGLYLSINAQCVVEVPLSQRASASTLIVEGKVISQNSFWNATNNMIYTSSQVEVYKIFKGSIATSVISIISEGGIVGMTKITAEPALNLRVGEIGVFTCAPPTHMHNLPANNTGIPQFETYASVQGFIKYDLNSETAADAFHRYSNVETELYPALLEPNRITYNNVRSFSIHIQAAQHSIGPNPTVQSITGFTPATVTAGTGSTITITGTGFGATQGSGSVGFKNGDDGGATYINPLPSQIISWSNTSIVVEVPSNAGTGTIQVTQGATQTSATSLTVSYSHLNVDFDPGSGVIAYQTDHINDNGTGGYTWRMNTAFDAATTERASFMRAFDSWRCATGVNWSIGATTSINDAVSDGTNVICNDNTAPLSAGILGVCYSYWSGCASGPTIIWYVNELDIIFDEGSNITPLTWQYGPSAPTGSQYDFETVAVHELGHGHQLGHVINNGAIMHYAISNGTSNRALGVNDLAGGNFVQAKSVVANVCGPGAMTAFTCASPPVAAFIGTPTTLCAGGTVAYTDQSTNTPTSWSWTFQGGTPSTSSLQNPTVTYSTAGTYSVSLTATNATGSDNQTNLSYITVNANPNLTASSQTNVSCNGGSNGSATVGISGGSPTYNYNWTPGNPAGDGTVTVTGLSASTFTCTVTDANSCTDTQTFTLTQPSAISLTAAAQTNLTCNGGSNGAASVNAATGGAGGFTYNWTPGNPTGDGTVSVTGLAAGSYTCTATDANGCTATRTFSITQPTVVTATTSQTNITCNAAANGIASVSASGGTPSYTYSWAPSGGTAASATGLAAGNYTCTITDANGCMLTKTFSITQPAVLDAIKTTFNVSCFGGNDASGSVAPTGGTGPFTYSWTPLGGNAATASNLVAGSYTCTITDANGCTKGKNFLITQPSPISISMSGADENCSGGDGQATATPSGGTGPYTYLWAPGGQTTQTALNLSAATYTCTVTDANGCNGNNTFVVNNVGCGGSPVAAFSGTPTTVCSGASVAFTDLSSNTPTSWTWSFPGGSPSGSSAQNPTVSYSTPGSYNVTLTVTNASGSDALTMTSYITVAAPPSASGTVTNISCFASTDGSIDLTPTGNAPFTYLWSPSAQTTQDRSGLTAGSYSVTVTDVNGCTFMTSFSITQPTAITAVMSGANSTCPDNDGTATAAPSGGTSPYTYLWSPGGQTTATAANLPAATYTCAITDANGCSSSRTFTVNQTGCGPAHLTSGFCGITLPSLSQQIYCTAVTNATNYQYKFMQGATVIAVYTRGNYLTNCLLTNIPQIQYAQTYTVLVRAMIGNTWGLYGSACTITTPAFPGGQVANGSCGTTLTGFNNPIYCTAIPGAANYEWKFMIGATLTATYQRGNYLTDCVPANVGGLSYGQTYDVYVRAYVGGVWGSYGAFCTVTMPTFPTTQVSSAWCNGTVPNLSSGISCNAVTGATDYQWKVESGAYVSIMNRGNNQTNWRLSWNSGTTVNTTYDVSVRAFVGGVWGTFGTVCTIAVGGNMMPQHPGDEILPAEVRIANPDMAEIETMSMEVYPNPFAANITVITNASVKAVLIYNSFGEFIRSVDLENGKAEINLGELASGIYLIQATSASGVITKTVIKQD
ncbi:MAG: PKD domain-containing protein [Bacteroidia bacterium]